MTGAGFLAVLDPPWNSDSGGGRVKRGADKHYALSSPDALALEYARSAPWLVSDPSLLFVWATTLALARGDAFKLIDNLDHRVCATFVWAKVDVFDGDRGVSVNHDELYGAPRQPGLGQWSRCEHEFLLLARRGSFPRPSTKARPRSVIYAPRGRHSEKPERAWSQVIEPIARDVMPGVVGVEFNARRRRRGWQAYGRLDGEGSELVFREALP